MADGTGIGWTNATWQVTHGCSVISPGCTNCYAMRMAHRLEMMGQEAYTGLTQHSKAGWVWNGTVRAASYESLTLPLQWKKPRRIFVDSMADLFAEGVWDVMIDRALAVAALCPQHTFQILTKRPDRMLEHMRDEHGALAGRVFPHWAEISVKTWGARFTEPQPLRFPLPNVWFGTSVEDRARLPRIDVLRQVPAALRFLSLEPLLEDLGAIDLTGIGWVIIGGESGPRARSMDIDWADNIVLQCWRAGVPVFVKQIGSKPKMHGFTGYPIKHRSGADMAEWPEPIQVQQFPGDRP